MRFVYVTHGCCGQIRKRLVVRMYADPLGGKEGNDETDAIEREERGVNWADLCHAFVTNTCAIFDA